MMTRTQQAEALLDPAGLFEALITRYEISLFDQFLQCNGQDIGAIYAQGQAIQLLRTFIHNEAGEELADAD
jgi:hypothetical protein